VNYRPSPSSFCQPVSLGEGHLRRGVVDGMVAGALRGEIVLFVGPARDLPKLVVKDYVNCCHRFRGEAGAPVCTFFQPRWR
jgi:hypothetical protein